MPYLFPEKIQCLYILSDIITILFLLLSFSLSIVYISSKPTITGYYTYIKTNWNLNPIMQISISDSSSSPTEFNSFGQWDGIISGCDCSNSTYATILKTVCNSTMTSSNCINITDIPSVPYSKWKGKFINVERLSAYTFKNYLYIQTKQNCKKGYKKCGVLDSMNHTLCVSNEAVCPINKLLIDQSATSPTDFKYTTLALDEGSYLHYTNENTNGKIIVSFKSSESTVCPDPTIQTKSTYSLDRYYSEKGCVNSEGKNLSGGGYELVDAISKEKLYNENGISEKIKSFAKKEYFKGTINLYARGYIGLNEEYDISSIDLNSFDSYDRMKLGTGVPIIVLSVFQVFIFLFSLITRGKGKKPTVINRSSKCYLSFQMTLIWISFITIICAIFGMIFFSEKKLSQGFDDISKEGIQEYFSYLGGKITLIVLIFIFELIVYLLNIFWFVNEYLLGDAGNLKDERIGIPINENINNVVPVEGAEGNEIN